MAAEPTSKPGANLQSKDQDGTASHSLQSEVPSQALVTAHDVSTSQNACNSASAEPPPAPTLNLPSDPDKAHGEKSPNDADMATDNDPERPIREKLKKTSIGTLSKDGLESNNRTETLTVLETPAEEQFAGQPYLTVNQSTQNPCSETQKENNDQQSTLAQQEETTRQKSDQLPDEDEQRPKGTSNESSSHPATPTDSAEPTPMDEDPRACVVSPRKKRSRDQFDKDLEKEPEATDVIVDEERRCSEDIDRENISIHRLSRTARDEPEKKRHRDISEDSALAGGGRIAKIPSDSGFANTSAVSPFGSLGQNVAIPQSGSKEGPKEHVNKPPQPSSLSFATSGFASLAGATSLFGTLGASQPSVFGTAGRLDSINQPSPGVRSLSPSNAQLSPSGFGGVPSTGISGFASKPSGFGSLGAGPGSGFGSTGQGLTSFASAGGAGVAGLSKGSAKAFGAPPTAEAQDNPESEDEQGDAEDGDPGGKEIKEDRRFHHQEVETGEEGEHTVFSGRAKLFHFDSVGKAWKERGFGVLKLNVSSGTGKQPGDPELESDSEEANQDAAAENEGERRTFARLLMRSEGVYRVVLNVPVFKTMQAGDHHGEVPSDRCIKFTALEEGRPTMMQLRFGNNTTAVELWHRIKEVQDEM